MLVQKPWHVTEAASTCFKTGAILGITSTRQWRVIKAKELISPLLICPFVLETLVQETTGGRRPFSNILWQRNTTFVFFIRTNINNSTGLLSTNGSIYPLAGINLPLTWGKLIQNTIQFSHQIPIFLLFFFGGRGDFFFDSVSSSMRESFSKLAQPWTFPLLIGAWVWMVGANIWPWCHTWCTGLILHNVEVQTKNQMEDVG